MQSIWVKCSGCGILFDKEEGRRAKGLVCPQCRVRLRQEHLIKKECFLCGRITLTKNGVCPWCDEDEWEEEPEVIANEPESLQDSYMKMPLMNVCHIRYPAVKHGTVCFAVSYQSTNRDAAMETVKKAASDVLQDVLYDCTNEKECRKLLGRPESKSELLRMIREAIMDEMAFDQNTIDIASLQISDLEVRDA